MEIENNKPAPEQPPAHQNYAEKVIQPLDPNLAPSQATPKLSPTPTINPASSMPGAVVGSTTNEQPVISTTPPTLATPNIQQSAGRPYSSSPSFSQTDAIAEESKRIRKRRLFIGGGVFVGLIALVVVGFIAYSSLLGFKTVTYDNGKGAKFQLKFYSQYTVKNAASSSGLQELASKVSKNGLYPLIISISKAPQKPSPSLLNCSGTGISSTALQITNKPTNNTVNICSIDQGQSTNPILYVGALQAGNSYYAVLINQDVNIQQVTSSEQNAQAGIKKIGLSAYNDDVTTIVSSIKPLQ